MMDGRKHLAHAMMQHGRHSAAGHALRAVLQSNPNDRQALYDYAVAMQRVGRYDEAERAWSRLAALDGAARPAHGAGPLAAVRRPPRGGLQRAAAFVRRLFVAALLAAAGLAVIDTREPGRMRWLAERLQWPSLGFLRERYEATGLAIHWREWQRAREAVAKRTELFDWALLGAATGLVILAALLALHALIMVRSRR